MRYIALVDGKAGAYGVVVPDLPGCTSAGPTTDEALRNAVEAVRLWAADAIDDGEMLPLPRSVEALRAGRRLEKRETNQHRQERPAFSDRRSIKFCRVKGRPLITQEPSRSPRKQKGCSTTQADHGQLMRFLVLGIQAHERRLIRPHRVSLASSR
jgi:predicted RNase H-like HicB family nuclease